MAANDAKELGTAMGRDNEVRLYCDGLETSSLTQYTSE